MRPSSPLSQLREIEFLIPLENMNSIGQPIECAVPKLAARHIAADIIERFIQRIGDWILGRKWHQFQIDDTIIEVDFNQYAEFAQCVDFKKYSQWAENYVQEDESMPLTPTLGAWLRTLGINYESQFIIFEN